MNRYVTRAYGKVFIAFSIALGTMTACKKDNVAAASVVDKKELKVYAGVIDTVTIMSSGGQWQVYSENENVAKAAIETNKIVVTTLQPGNGRLRLNNGNTNVYIDIKAQPMYGGWRFKSDPDYNPIIEVSDPAIAAAIRAAVAAVSREYFFSQNNKVEVAILDANRNPEKLEGEYLLKNSLLSITYNGFTQQYTLGAPPSLHLLMQDLTTYYQQKYPNAGVSRVMVRYKFQYYTYG